MIRPLSGEPNYKIPYPRKDKLSATISGEPPGTFCDLKLPTLLRKFYCFYLAHTSNRFTFLRLEFNVYMDVQAILLKQTVPLLHVNNGASGFDSYLLILIASFFLFNSLMENLVRTQLNLD